MNVPVKDPLSDALERLADNAHWRHYVGTLSAKRDAAIRKLLYSDSGNTNEIQALKGEARAFDQLIDQLKRHGVKT